MPVSMFSKVVLPAPFGPMIECTLPGRMTNDRPSIAWTPPNALDRFSTASKVIGVPRIAGRRSPARPCEPAPERRHDALREEHHGRDQDRAEDHHHVVLQ